MQRQLAEDRQLIWIWILGDGECLVQLELSAVENRKRKLNYAKRLLANEKSPFLIN